MGILWKRMWKWFFDVKMRLGRNIGGYIFCEFIYFEVSRRRRRKRKRKRKGREGKGREGEVKGREFLT